MATVSALQPVHADALPGNLQLNFFQSDLAVPDMDIKGHGYAPPSDKVLSAYPNVLQAQAQKDSASLNEPPTSVPDDERGRNDGDHDPLNPVLENGQHFSHPKPTSQGVSARHTTGRFSLDDDTSSGNVPPLLNGGLMDSGFLNDSFKSLGESLTVSQPPPSSPLQVQSSRDIPVSLHPANSRQTPYHLSEGASHPRFPPNSLSRPYSPTLGIPIPISTNPRAYPQHPTFITPAAAPDPINPILSPTPLQPPEEVCVECAMRDQDMADVIVTGPGVWDRESDVLYQELLRREEEEETAGILRSECSSRPRARGGRLTEQNLKLWNMMNPREPMARQQTLSQYVKAQRSLLEAEALAHARAMQESKQLENSVKDTYAQLRRSVLELDGVDDSAFKLKPSRPTSVVNGNGTHHIRGASRDITLLRNGLIVEHVDVRREEKDERERRRRREKQERSRPRKSSRASAIDVTSLYSSNSIVPHTDNGFGVMSSPRLSGVGTRPASSLTVPVDRQASLSQAYSQASFSDAHSPGSVSPRRSRFFGFKNLSGAWRSQDSLAASGMSGSMIDMHVALQRENYASTVRPPADRSRLPSQMQSQLWPPAEDQDGSTLAAADQKPKKKKKRGFAKIWSLVKGSSGKSDTRIENLGRSQDRHDDDSPLTPPPPLSYLVERGPGEHLNGNGRHASTPSLLSTTSPWNGLSSPGMSPPTAPSSLLPSPTSSRPSGGNGDVIEKKVALLTDDKEAHETVAPDARLRPVHPVTSEPDIRQKVQSPNNMTLPKSTSTMLSREKSLPPLPGEWKPRSQNIGSESRPQSFYTYDPRHGNHDPYDLAPPHAPFRTEARRQSFSGVTSRPTLGIQTMPSGGHDYTRSPNGFYNEFGISQRSLGRLDNIEENPPVPPTPKRKSKLIFASLLGRKSNNPCEMSGSISHEFPRLSTPMCDGNEDSLYSAYTSSRQSAGPRMSIMSRKAIEELVDQDREFVAYRYPSQTHSLGDLLR
ncbi:hypothetical protein F5J12DRAFT_798263 [Pisolithus orientalis]|uniref:uncharacterized protein n=1 Tax=Pisolithus orientalis TaxID=936130 RepID=UPI002224B1CC|nr:uncharacterized protein F5J12DRAFT_798263 [Pisolithus orientalis]KAI6033028.1 hypothetical protein F5J12DRAFT_798263 [Pisolithus orientalis]